jgi:hypothetical protein
MGRRDDRSLRGVAGVGVCAVVLVMLVVGSEEAISCLLPALFGRIESNRPCLFVDAIMIPMLLRRLYEYDNRQVRVSSQDSVSSYMSIHNSQFIQYDTQEACIEAIPEI